MRPTRIALKTDIHEQLTYGPALIKQAFRRRLHRLTNGSASIADNVIISLTSFPQRLPKLHRCIRSLLGQSVRAERIVLYLARDECIGTDLSARLRTLQGDAFDIRFVDTNVRSLNKIYHTLSDFPDKTIVTCDDDKLYPHEWLEGLVRTSHAYPDFIACQRSRQIAIGKDGEVVRYRQWPPTNRTTPSLDVLPMGVGGVLYPPGSLHPDVRDAELFRDLSETSDDLWLKIMSLRLGTPCVQVGLKPEKYPSIPFWNGQKLSPGNIWEDGNDKNLKRLLAHFDLDLAELLSADDQTA